MLDRGIGTLDQARRSVLDVRQVGAVLRTIEAVVDVTVRDDPRLLSWKVL